MKYKIGQYFHIKATSLILRNIYKKTKPDYKLKSIIEIELKWLKQSEFEKIIFDKDNTLTLPYQTNYPDISFKNKITELQGALGINNVLLCSNTSGSRDDHNFAEAEKIEAELQIKVIRHNSKKPNLNLSKILKLSEFEKVLVVGDRLMVDIYMGKENNMKTLLVSPLDTSKENIMVYLMRCLERLLE